MKQSQSGLRGTNVLYLLTILVAVVFGGFAISKYLVPVTAQKKLDKSALSNIVRGYIAVAVGRSAKVESSGGLYAKEIDGRDIYLPGVEVYLEDPQIRKVSKTAKTDLSGRFTLYAPEPGRYRICWNSDVYGSGCTAVFVPAGSSPQFVSTVDIRVPDKKDYVAVMGHVTAADGTSPRTLDPLMNINAFATVRLDNEKGGREAEVYVNNFGDYLLPYVPVRQKIKLTAAIESGRYTQEIFPEAQIERARLHEINLKIANNRPHIDPLVAIDSSNKPVQNAVPGSEINIKANARDSDGDQVDFVWFVDPNEGELSKTTGPNVQWKLPKAAGSYHATVIAYDNKGGYDKAVLSVLTGAKGIPFTGIVIDPDGTPVKEAEIEIVGNPVIKTDANGRFQTNVEESDRYVCNVRKEDYALNSQVYDRGVTGGRWILRRGEGITIDPKREVTISHQRGKDDCPGPDSARAGLGVAGNSLKIPQWQDGKGNVIDPPSWNRPSATVLTSKEKDLFVPRAQDQRQPIVMPRDLKLPACGPGVSVRIPANSILDAEGNPAEAPLKVTIATVDLVSPQQMPGDGSVVPSGGSGGNLESFGAGSLDLPPGFKLKPDATAMVTIPVDRSRLGDDPLPATVPFLTYDEKRGLWIEEGTLSLTTVAGVQSYVGETKHFSTFDASFVRRELACVRVFSEGMPSPYVLEVSVPREGTTPRIIKQRMLNTTPVGPREDVIFNLPANTNISLAPMTPFTRDASGVYLTNSQLLGFYIVNSGPAASPNPSAPYTRCQNFIVLTPGNAPQSPFGGEFLHGLGFIDAANLGLELNLARPTGSALRDAIVRASTDYLRFTDLESGRGTLEQFKSNWRFPTNEIVAQYANSGDLGFGRDMHCVTNEFGVACYVTNYGDGYTNLDPGGGTNDQEDANAAGHSTMSTSAEGATVAMEYSASIPGDLTSEKVVKFYVYKLSLITGNRERSISANLDGRGERPVPQLCMICHGGQIPEQEGGVPAFGSIDQVKLGSRFLPFDYRLFTFPNDQPSLTRENQEANIRNLNQQIVNVAPPAPLLRPLEPDPIRELIAGLYSGPPGRQDPNFTPFGWRDAAPVAFPNQARFYQTVIANNCRTCHIAQPFSQLQFNTSDKFVNLFVTPSPDPVTSPTPFDPASIAPDLPRPPNRLMLGTAQLRVCGDYTMPHAFRTHEIFWGAYSGPPPIPGVNMPQEFQNFGNDVPALGTSTWNRVMCTSFISPLTAMPSLFYERSIQSIWNAKCVGCHIDVVGARARYLPLTERASYGGLIPDRVVRSNDDPNFPGNELLRRISYTDSRDPNFAPTNGDRMPKDCEVPPARSSGVLPCLTHADIDKIKAWIRSGAN